MSGSPSKNSATICGVIGNPIAHSLSPQIHQEFAKQIKLDLDYQKYLIEQDNLETFVRDFFRNGGTGLNVTLPFKQQVLKLVDELSEAASICQAVNTLSIAKNGNIRGDTTDGAGLILDLKRLHFEFENKNILVVGAGGASISVIHGLLKNRSKVTLHNRSQGKISEVVSQFSDIGQVDAFSEEKNVAFDGLICAISQFNQALLEPAVSRLDKNAFIYDLNYGERAAETLDFFKQKGFEKCSDGYGMLVGQAAKSFEIWHGVLPSLAD